MDENRAVLDGWKLDMSIEDSTSGRVQIVAVCDSFLVEFLGDHPVPNHRLSLRTQY
jgi:hypothetical protein